MSLDGWEEYRFLIEDTQQVSARRQSNNNVYLSATSIILGGGAFLAAQGALRNAMMLGVLFVIGVAGITVSWEWGRQNRIYKRYLAFRYDLLKAMEAGSGPAADYPIPFPFPIKVFHVEEAEVYAKSGRKIIHFGFSESELRLPYIFMALYVFGILGIGVILAYVAWTGQWAAWGVSWP